MRTMRTAFGPEAGFRRGPAAAAEAGGRPQAPASLAIEPGDRKVCSILFADIAKSTLLIGDLDPDEALARLGPVVQEIINTCDSFGATVRYTGDGAVAVFGYPKSDEDHALKAVECARAIIDRIAGMGAERVDVRIGIHSGDILISNVTHAQFTELALSGTVVHVARKIEEGASRNTVTVSADVVDALGEMFGVRKVREHVISEDAEPVAIYEVEGRNDLMTRWSSRAHKGLSPFVGRAVETGRLAAAWDAVKAGGSRALMLVGPAGVGKSRLVHEFLNRIAGDGAGWLEFSASSLDQSAAYLPVTRELSRQLSAAGDGASVLEAAFDDADETERLQRDALLSILGLARASPALALIEPVFKKKLMLRALARGIRMASGHGPRILLFEDIHWADEDTSALIDLLLSELEDESTLILMTSRTREKRAPVLEQVPIDPLETDACRDLIGRLLAAEDSDMARREGIQELIARASDRTPLFIEEIVHHLKTFVAANSDGAPDDAAWTVPTSVRPLIAQRIDALETADKRALQLASAIGTEFRAGTFSAALRHQGADPDRGIEALTSARLLQWTGSESVPKLRFEHALIHQVAYQSMPKSRRRLLHRSLLTVIEGLGGKPDLETARAMAHHAERGGLWDRAADAFVFCGRLAIDRASFDSAAAHFDAALRCVSSAGPDAPGEALIRAGIQARQGLRIALLPRADFSRIFRIAGEVAELSAEVGDEDAAIRALVDQSLMLSVQSDVREAVQVGQRALNRAEAHGDPSLTANSAFVLGQSLWFRGSYRRAAAVIEHYRTLFRSAVRTINTGTTGSVSVLASATRANALSLIGAFDAAAAEIANAKEIAVDTGKVYDTCFSLTAEGILRLYSGEPADAAAALDEAMTRSRDADIEVLSGFIAAPLARAMTAKGWYDEAASMIDRGLAVPDRMQMAAFRAWLHAARFELIAAEQGWADAEPLFRELMADCTANGYLGMQAMVLTDAALASGDPGISARAEALVRRLGMLPMAARLAAARR